MRRALPFVVAALLGGCASPGVFDNNDLVLSPSYRAKEVCSCIFVMNMGEDFCAAWTVASPNISGFSIDRTAKTVTSSALLLWGARARFVSERDGCTEE